MANLGLGKGDYGNRIIGVEPPTLANIYGSRTQVFTPRQENSINKVGPAAIGLPSRGFDGTNMSNSGSGGREIYVPKELLESTHIMFAGGKTVEIPKEVYGNATKIVEFVNDLRSQGHAYMYAARIGSKPGEFITSGIVPGGRLDFGGNRPWSYIDRSTGKLYANKTGDEPELKDLWTQFHEATQPNVEKMEAAIKELRNRDPKESGGFSATSPITHPSAVAMGSTPQPDVSIFSASSSSVGSQKLSSSLPPQQSLPSNTPPLSASSLQSPQPANPLQSAPAAMSMSPAGTTLGRFGAMHTMRGPRDPFKDMFKLPKPTMRINKSLPKYDAYAQKRAELFTSAPIHVRVNKNMKLAKAKIVEYESFPTPRFDIVLSGNFYNHNKNKPSVLKNVISHEVLHIAHPFNHNGNFKSLAKGMRIPKKFRGMK